MGERKELKDLFEEKGPDTLFDMILNLRSDNRVKTGLLKAAQDDRVLLAAKVDELKNVSREAAEKTKEFKALQLANNELGNMIKAREEKILELQDINTQMGQAIQLIKSDLEAAQIKLKDEKRDNEIIKDSLTDYRTDMKAKLEECGKEKESINKSMEQAVDKLRNDLHAAKEKGQNTEVDVDRLGGQISRLQLQLRALKAVEAKQKVQLQEWHTKHENDQESLRLVKEHLTNEVNSCKATNKLLREELEKNQASLKKALNLASGSNRPSSPVARAKAEDKRPGDDKKPKCTFVRIGNKKDEFGNEIGDYKKDCSGGVRSKSPLNPNQLARKIKYRF